MYHCGPSPAQFNVTVAEAVIALLSEVAAEDIIPWSACIINSRVVCMYNYVVGNVNFEKTIPNQTIDVLY